MDETKLEKLLKRQAIYGDITQAIIMMNFTKTMYKYIIIIIRRDANLYQSDIDQDSCNFLETIVVMAG